MPDPPTDPNEEISLPKNAQEELDKERQHAILIEQIRRDLETNPRYKEFFARYDSSSVKWFIEDYSRRKAEYMDHGEEFSKYEEKDLLRFETEGAERLMEIQLKKLFNCECLGRAENLRIPAVEQAWDFRYWENHIERCPFLSPITEEEVELYADYVLSDRFEEDPDMAWDDLRFRAEWDDDGDFDYPEWFTLYDLRFGTGLLFKLPDIRGEKESFYLDLCHAEERKKAEEGKESTPPPDNLPRIAYNDLAFIETFIRQFEDGKMLRHFRTMENFHERYDDGDLEEAMEILRYAEEPVPVDAADNWKDAIINAADRFRRRKLAEGVRAAYSEYLIRLENKLSADEKGADDFVDTIRKKIKENLIKGRVMNGEPPDLNF